MKEDKDMTDYLQNFSLNGKVALITGASYGIGFAIAKAMAGAGATIVFNDIKQELVDKGLAAYKEEGIEAHGYVCDVTDEDAVNGMVAAIEKEVGVIDILVNNAGIIKRIPMCDMSAAEFRQVIDVDLNAPFIVSKAVIPSMIKKGHGKIINICSMMSELGRETVSAYAAAKGGLKMLTKNIASEYGEYSVTVSGLAILQHRRQRLCARSSRTAPDIPLTSSSLPRHRPAAGARQRIWADQPYSWHPRHPILSTALYCTWMAASWPTSASSQNNLRQLKSGGPDRIGPLPDGMGVKPWER